MTLAEAALALRETLALPAPEPVAAEVRHLETGADFVLRRIEYRGDEDDLIPALLFVPRGRERCAGALVHHQHNSEWHLGKSEVAGAAGAPLQAFGPALARRGMVVLAPDALGFEERRISGRGTDPHPRDWLEHHNEMAYRLVRGQLLMRKLMSDALRAISVLVAQPEVDATRIGVLGHSVGGITALYHAVVDPRVRFGCASGSATTLQSRMARGVGIAMLEIIPGAAARWTTATLLAEAARRPFLVVSADQDPYAMDAPSVVAAARAHAAGRRDVLALDHFHGTGMHALDQARHDAILDWMAARAR